MQWRAAGTGDDAMSGASDDQISYATGWTISGLATHRPKIAKMQNRERKGKNTARAPAPAPARQKDRPKAVIAI